MFEHLRAHRSIPGRSSRVVRRDARLIVEDGSINSTKIKKLPLDEHPGAVAMFSVPFPPGIMMDETPRNDTGGILSITPLMPDFWERVRKLPYTVQIARNLDASRFLRMIAKIAHCAAVATLGIDEFIPLLSDVILGKSDCLQYFIGGPLFPEVRGNDFHEIHIEPRRRFDGQVFYSARIRLLASEGAPNMPGTPTHYVVVGTPKPGVGISRQQQLRVTRI